MATLAGGIVLGVLLLAALFLGMARRHIRIEEHGDSGMDGGPILPVGGAAIGTDCAGSDGGDCGGGDGGGD